MTTQRWWRVIAILFAFSLIAAACGGDDDADDGAAPDAAEETSTDDAAPEEEAPAAEEDMDEPEAAAEPEDEESVAEADLGQVTVAEGASCADGVPELDRGTFNPSGHLRFADSIRINSLNPHDDQAPASFSFYGWIYEGLVRQDNDGSVVPWLAKCWDTSEDGTEVTFILHEGVTFHDGTPMNADAVVANVEFIKTAGPPNVIPPVAGQLGIVDSVEAVDEHTVKFNLAGPGEVLLLSGLMRNSGQLVSPAALGNAAETPIGTGPYAFTGANADFTEIDLVGYDGYWQPGLVGAETARIDVAVDAAARLDALNAGQYDIAVILSRQRPNLVDAIPFSAPTVRIGFVFADWTGQTVPQLANRDVRCAMAGALNRAGIVEQVTGSTDAVNFQFATGPTDYAYIDDLDVPDFDIEAAKAAFAATGEDGFTFDNRHLPGGFWPVLSSAWSTALAEMGITMVNGALDPPSAGNMFQSLAQGLYPVQIIAYNEPNALMSLIARTGQAAFNPSGVSPEGVDELVNSAKGKSFADGEADVAAAWKIMLEECVFVINHTLTTWLAHQPNVTGAVHVQGLPITFWPHGVRVN
ncbi:MAG: ABC transporter substrate-binding protein [Acidimicrobiaceae bacterium]|nr:ABC transporter substrate-binding protein [Acidimicrobiaceae bacterium]